MRWTSSWAGGVSRPPSRSGLRPCTRPHVPAGFVAQPATGRPDQIDRSGDSNERLAATCPSGSSGLLGVLAHMFHRTSSRSRRRGGPIRPTGVATPTNSSPRRALTVLRAFWAIRTDRPFSKPPGLESPLWLAGLSRTTTGVPWGCWIASQRNTQLETSSDASSFKVRHSRPCRQTPDGHRPPLDAPSMEIQPLAARSPATPRRTRPSRPRAWVLAGPREGLIGAAFGGLIEVVDPFKELWALPSFDPELLTREAGAGTPRR